MSRSVFVTGTDTDCGKTHVSAALLRALQRRGERVAGYKPVAAGAARCGGEWRNDDALTLQDAGSRRLSYAAINPYCFAEPVSPHIAAERAGTVIDPDVIVRGLQDLEAAFGRVVVEGAGGWFVPLGPGLDIAGLVQRLARPVIMVVGLRLGCLNHAQLTEAAITGSGARLLGWIGTQVDPQMDCLEENVETLRTRLSTPCLGLMHAGISVLDAAATEAVVQAWDAQAGV
jgi:dethiobiotin synthetase